MPRGIDRHCRRFVWLAFFCVWGCGSDAEQLDPLPVTGKVTLDGQPLSQATVTFLSTGPGGMSAIGTTDEEGVYALSAGPYVGALAGEYKVTITHYTMKDGSPVKAPDEIGVEQLKMTGEVQQTLPPHYSDERLSQLSMTVAEGKSEGYDLPLTSKK